MCQDCRFLRQDIKILGAEIPKKFGNFTNPCNRYPQNIMRSPKEPACGEFEEKECKDCKKYKTCINSTHPYWKKLAEENKGCRGFKEKK
jgi:hypothetical protein